MATREEIREGIAGRIYKWYFRNSQLNDLGEWGKVRGATRGMVLAITDIVLEYEDSQGVVIKRDKEMPEDWIRGLKGKLKLTDWDYEDVMLYLDRSGYMAVEPLIKE